MELSRRSFLKLLSALPAVTLIETLPAIAKPSPVCQVCETGFFPADFKHEFHATENQFVMEFDNGPEVWLTQFCQLQEPKPFQLPRGRFETDEEYYRRSQSVAFSSKFTTSVCACDDCLTKTHTYIRHWMDQLFHSNPFLDSDPRRRAVMKYREKGEKTLTPFGVIVGLIPTSYSIEFGKSIQELNLEFSYDHFDISKQFTENSYGT